MKFTRASLIVAVINLTVFGNVVSGKIYQRCDLVRELRNFDVPEEQIPTWVCIVQHESNYDTGAMNPGSGDHGLFQISQVYWCSPPGYGCNARCSSFRDEDISDDLQCVRRIFNEHKRISGNGFNAWAVYPLYCKNDTSKYMQGCPDAEVVNAVAENEVVPVREEVDEYGDGYHFPPLPKSDLQLPFDKESITYSVPAIRGNFEEGSSLPFSKVSIHHFIAIKEDTTVTNKEDTTTDVAETGLITSTVEYSTTNVKSIEKFTTTTTTTKLPASVDPAESRLVNNVFTRTKKPALTSTTSKPKAKQVTFAPDSFFSWLFNSQTLPPIVPPVRPSRPPNGGPPTRPTTFRPVGEQLGPGGRPRPTLPGPQRPPGLRPDADGEQLGVGGRPRPTPQRPQRPGLRPDSDDINRNRRPHRRPGHRRPLRPHALDLESVRNDQVSSAVENKFSNVTMKNGRQIAQGVEVKLDGNFVFFRTKYGYRLFKNEK